MVYSKRNEYDDKYWEEVIIPEYLKKGVTRKKIQDMFNTSDREMDIRLKGLKNNLDYELVIKKYEELKNVNRTAQFFNVSHKRMEKLLNSLNVNIYPCVRKHKEKKWSEEKLIEIISKYGTRYELKKENSPAFHAAAKMGLLKRHYPTDYSKEFRHLYVFLFHNSKSVYVGLTCNVKKRYKSHLNSNLSPKLISPVLNYINKTNETFEFKVLTETPLPELIASEKECEIIDEYKLNGWTLINRKKGGGLGGIPKWSYEELKKISSKYSSQKDFINNEPNAYDYAKKINVLEDIFSNMKKTWNQFTYEQMLVESKKYSSLGEFKQKSKTVYHKARRLGVLSEISLHMRNGNPTKWTYDLVFKESIKYNTKSEFKNKCGGAYYYALRFGIIGEVCSHMKIMKNNWSIQEIFEISKQYDSLVNLRCNNESVYRKSVKLGISKKLYPKT